MSKSNINISVAFSYPCTICFNIPLNGSQDFNIRSDFGPSCDVQLGTDMTIICITLFQDWEINHLHCRGRNDMLPFVYFYQIAHGFCIFVLMVQLRLISTWLQSLMECNPLFCSLGSVEEKRVANIFTELNIFSALNQ